VAGVLEQAKRPTFEITSQQHGLTGSLKVYDDVVSHSATV